MAESTIKFALRWKQINRQFKDDISVHCFVDKLQEKYINQQKGGNNPLNTLDLI